MKLICFFLLSLLLSLSACSDSQPGKCQPEIAWYYWKSSWSKELLSAPFLQSPGQRKIYLRLFDVDWDEGSGQALPVGQLQGQMAAEENEVFIPVIFISNRTLKHLTEGDMETLATRILGLAQRYLPSPKELQLDCDWTQSTAPLFFKLVESVKEKLPETTISITVRLHQFKYPELTGVPPADRGMLMVYNMGDIEKWETENAIIDPSIAAQYLQNEKSYPLPLDIALPLFQWGCTYRDLYLVQLFHNLSKEELSDTTRFERLSGKRFLTKKNTFLRGFFLNKGDFIRLEEVKTGDLKAVAAMLNPLVDCCKATVAFYHLDSLAIQKYSPGELNGVLRSLCD